MAEIALGGIQLARSRGRATLEPCTHPDALVVSTSGLDRILCETCGHVSFKYERAMSPHVSRAQFARPVDRIPEPVRPAVDPLAEWKVTGPEDAELIDLAAYEDEDFEVFAMDERYHIRSRYELHPHTPLVLAS